MKKAHRNFQIKPWMGCMGFWASSASCRSTGADGIICFLFSSHFLPGFSGDCCIKSRQMSALWKMKRALCVLWEACLHCSVFCFCFCWTGGGLAGIRCFCSGLWGIRCALWRLQLLLITWTGRREPWTALFVI